MSTSKGAKVEIGVLRSYAKFLRHQAEILRDDVRKKVGDGLLPNSAWGTAYTNFLPGVDADKTWTTKGGHTVLQNASIRADAPGIQAFRAAYETAHEMALTRLTDLAMVYTQTANDIDWVADTYEQRMQSSIEQIGNVDE